LFSPDEVLLVLPPPPERDYLSAESIARSISAEEIEKYRAKAAAEENAAKRKVMTLLTSITVFPEFEGKCENDKCFTMEAGERIVTWETHGEWRNVKAMSGKHKGQEGWAVLYVDQFRPVGP
jgi:hypothetical protein